MVKQGEASQAELQPIKGSFQKIYSKKLELIFYTKKLYAKKSL